MNYGKSAICPWPRRCPRWVCRANYRAAPRPSRRSWERCARAGLRPDRFEVPYDADVDHRGRLCWAAGPVLDRVGDDLDGTGVGLLLTDQRAWVLARRVADHDTAGLLDRVQLAPGYGYREEQIGTNAIGTAIAGRGPALVVGQEHFADALTRLACAAVTVADPATGRAAAAVPGPARQRPTDRDALRAHSRWDPPSWRARPPPHSNRTDA